MRWIALLTLLASFSGCAWDKITVRVDHDWHNRTTSITLWSKPHE